MAAAWNLVAEQVLLLLVGLEDRLHEPQESLLLQAPTLFSAPPTCATVTFFSTPRGKRQCRMTFGVILTGVAPHAASFRLTYATRKGS